MTSPGDETPAQRLRRLVEAKRLAGLGAEVILPACACVNSIVHKQKITEVDRAWSWTATPSS